MEHQVINTNTIKLNGPEDWPVWRFQAEVIIRSRGYEYLLTEASKEENTSGTPQKTPSDKKKDDAKLQELLVTRIGPGPMTHILTCKSGYDMWSKLRAVYEKESNVSAHLLQQRFFNLQYKESMSTFLSNIEEVRGKLSRLGEEIPDSMVITKVIMSLPPAFHHFSSAWESVAKDTQTLQYLTSRLLIEEERLQANEETQALRVFGPVKKGNINQPECFICHKRGHLARECSRRKERECFSCHKVGHKAVNCWKKNNDKRHGNTTQNGFIAGASGDREDCWYLDTGASRHMCWNRELFTELQEHSVHQSVVIGDGNVLDVKGIGKVNVQAKVGHKLIDSTLSNVFYVPELKYNLFSVGCALDKGFVMTSNNKKCEIVDSQGNVRAVAIRHDKLFTMLFQTQCTNQTQMSKVLKCEMTDCFVAKRVESLYEWHLKLAHQNAEYCRQYLNKNSIKFIDESFVCEKCVSGKQCRKSFPRSESRATKVLQLVHADVCGPMEVPSMGGTRYFLLLKDDYSSLRVVYFLKYKSEVKLCIEKFIASAERETGCRVCVIRSDNGLEFVNREVGEMLQRRGIVHQRTVNYTPEQNGRAEREMRTLVEAARSMITGMGKHFWAEAVNTVAYIINRTGPSQTPGKTPYELFYGKAATSIQFQMFGSRVAVHVPKQKRLKWDPKSHTGIFIGYGDGVKGYRVYFPSGNKIEVVRDVIFLPQEVSHVKGMQMVENEHEEDKRSLNGVSQENVEHGGGESEERSKVNEERLKANEERLKVNEERSKLNEERSKENESSEVNEEEKESDERLVQNVEAVSECSEGNEDFKSADENSESPHVRGRPDGLRNKRLLKKPKRLEDYMVLVADVEGDEPRTYEQAISCEIEGKKWKEAIENEVSALEENKTWVSVNSVPPGVKVIDCKWVFKRKRCEQGDVTTYKARLVARGFQQRDVDMHEIYSPVAKLSSVRLFMSVCGMLKIKVFQLDVCSAFLYGDIDCDVYIKTPRGINCNETVLKLNKSLYGLKSSPKNWNVKFDTVMMSMVFQRSEFEHCLYVKVTDKCKVYLLVYVDDLLLAGTDHNEVLRVQKCLNEKFKMKDLGPISYFLGIHVKQDIQNNTFVLSQSTYLKNLLVKNNMYKCKPVSTPMDANFDHSVLKREGSESEEIENKCRSLIGGLMYAMLCTRPDLSICISILSRYQSCASNDLWIALKRVLRYVQGTLNLSLVFKSDDKKVILGYVDSDWAGDKVDRKSTAGYAFKVFGCTISWMSRKQEAVALSSTEAEYVAISLAVSEACWIQNMISDFRLYKDKVNVTLFEDNQGAIKVCKSSFYHTKLKHVDIRVHFVRNKIKENNIQIEYISTKEQLGDILTKPVVKLLFEYFRSKLGVL